MHGRNGGLCVQWGFALALNQHAEPDRYLVEQDNRYREADLAGCLAELRDELNDEGDPSTAEIKGAAGALLEAHF